MRYLDPNKPLPTWLVLLLMVVVFLAIILLIFVGPGDASV